MNKIHKNKIWNVYNRKKNTPKAGSLCWRNNVMKK